MGEEESESDKGVDCIRLLRCGQCGRVGVCSRKDLLGYMAQGWPKCGGEVMTLFIAMKCPGGAPQDPEGTEKEAQLDLLGSEVVRQAHRFNASCMAVGEIPVFRNSGTNGRMIRKAATSN